MAKPVLGRAHRQVLADHIDAMARARGLEEKIAARAAELEKGLLADAERLKTSLATCASNYKRRRLERDYLKCMHDLAGVRRARMLARDTVDRVPTRGLATPATTERKGLVGRVRLRLRLGRER